MAAMAAAMNVRDMGASQRPGSEVRLVQHAGMHQLGAEEVMRHTQLSRSRRGFSLYPSNTGPFLPAKAAG